MAGIYRDVSDVVDCLAAQQNALAGRRMALAVTLQVASLVLSALQLAAVGEGALDPRTSCSCNVDVRPPHLAVFHRSTRLVWLPFFLLNIF